MRKDGSSSVPYELCRITSWFWNIKWEFWCIYLFFFSDIILLIFFFFFGIKQINQASQVVLVVNNLPASAGNMRCGSDPWVGKIL